MGWLLTKTIDIKEYKRLYYLANKDRIKDSRREYYLANRDKVIAANKDYLSRVGHANKRKANAKYKMLNPDKNAANTSKRRCSKLQRTPNWLTPDEFKRIKDMYKLAKQLTDITGIKHVVDHVIPLQGKIVSGLHVPENLQVLTSRDNLTKSNKY